MKNRLQKEKKNLWTLINNIKKNAAYFNFEMFTQSVKFPSSVI